MLSQNTPPPVKEKPKIEKPFERPDYINPRWFKVMTRRAQLKTQAENL